MNNEVPTVLPEMDHTFYFEDYSPEELMAILSMCLEKRNLYLEPNAVSHIKKYIGELCENRPLGYANARTMSLLAKNITDNYLLRISMTNKVHNGQVILKDVEKFVWKTVLQRKRVGF